MSVKHSFVQMGMFFVVDVLAVFVYLPPLWWNIIL